MYILEMFELDDYEIVTKTNIAVSAYEQPLEDLASLLKAELRLVYEGVWNSVLSKTEEELKKLCPLCIAYGIVNMHITSSEFSIKEILAV